MCAIRCFLSFVGGQVAAGGVGSPAVVPAFDPGDDHPFGFGPGGEPEPVDQLLFQRGEESLRRAVVEACSYGSHRLGDTQVAAQLPVFPGGVLGGFNWWSQHLGMMEVPGGSACWLDEGVGGSFADEVA